MHQKAYISKIKQKLKPTHTRRCSREIDPDQQQKTKP